MTEIGSAQQVLAASIEMCKHLTNRYLAGFNSLNHTRQADNLPNHIAWTLGHCALTMHRVAQQLDSQDLPDTDFSFEPCSAATDDPTFCYHTESVAFNSRPVDDPAIYPSFERCVQIYERACERLAAAVAAASPEQLQQNAQWGRTELPLYALVVRIAFHNGMHTGQIADLRRALNMPSIFVER
jgi:hypothetical protein